MDAANAIKNALEAAGIEVSDVYDDRGEAYVRGPGFDVDVYSEHEKHDAGADVVIDYRGRARTWKTREAVSRDERPRLNEAIGRYVRRWTLREALTVEGPDTGDGSKQALINRASMALGAGASDDDVLAALSDDADPEDAELSMKAARILNRDRIGGRRRDRR